MPKLRAGNDSKTWPRPSTEKMLRTCIEVQGSKGWLGKRNAAILSTLPLFGSRASENSMLKRENVEIGDGSVFVTFSILKLHHTPRVRCSSCMKVSKATWKFCPSCGGTLSGLEPLPFKAPQTDILRQRKLSHPLARFFVEWFDEVPPGGWLFPRAPPGLFNGQGPDWTHRLSRQGIYMVVRRNLEEYWPHLFRHSLATSFSKLGYTENDLMKWFGWTRYETAVRYTRLGGGAQIKSMGESSA